MDELMAFDHIHLISRDPKGAADWYREMFGGEVTHVQENLRGAPQLDVRVGGMTIVIRGQRPGERPPRPGPCSISTATRATTGGGRITSGSLIVGTCVRSARS